MVNPKPELADYRRLLEEVCFQLAASAEYTGVRGSDLAQFALAESRGRSVTISWSENGVYSDYWVGDNETGESVHPSYEAAVAAAREWLSGAEGSAELTAAPDTGHR